ncbi:V-type proton ATPase subunit e1 [Sesamum alatum]|uniref:V-type proton ATPase subunit e1 n=1 Tax=Sesamum alatum TaxID=300844 RepID=A0AAE2CG25_9LAMI|nr:V-type proton ATPase subunit e1 [Sesamum alatum]
MFQSHVEHHLAIDKLPLVEKALNLIKPTPDRAVQLASRTIARRRSFGGAYRVPIVLKFNWICCNRGPSANLLHLTLIITATVCCWMMWAIVYLSQMKPLIVLILNETE